MVLSQLQKDFLTRTASELTIGESAMLVGLLPSPANYSPLRNLNKAIETKVHCFEGHVQSRLHQLATRSIWNIIALYPDNISYEIPRGKAPYFAEHVRRILEKQDDAVRYQYLSRRIKNSYYLGLSDFKRLQKIL